MKILLSAFSCRPNVGSEPGIGWNWSIRLAERNDVVVLTREKMRPFIETELMQRPQARLQFVFLEVPMTQRISDVGFAVYLKYILWQLAAFPLAVRLHRKFKFDVAQHLTIGTFRYPSWLGFLGIPFVFGPVGGGERAPIRLFRGLPLREQWKERLRTAVILSSLLDPFLRVALSRADLYVARSRQTLQIAPASLRRKGIVQQDIGANPEEIVHRPRDRLAGEPLRVLMVCRLVGWKGIHLAIDAVRQIVILGSKVTVEVCGTGSLLTWLLEEVEAHGLQESFRFVGGLSLSEVKNKYFQADIFLFPSLHDSGGTAVIEALGYGLPVICLDLGGPAEIVTEECGIVVSTSGRDRADVGIALAQAVIALERNESRRQGLALGAIARAHELLWSKQVGAVEAIMEKLVELRQTV